MCAAISVGEKMAASRNDHLMKQRSVIEFLTAEGCSAVAIHKRMKAVYGDACLTEGKVRKWARFYRGEDPKETTVRDRKRPGRPVSATDTMHQQKVDEMIVANRRVKQKDIANALDISKERAHHIITVHLGYRKVSARWVPRQLTVEMKAQRKTICTQLLERFTHDGERFLRSIITGDESWVHHYDPESKMQSMQYRHKNSPAPKNFKVVASARKVLLTMFWDMEGIVRIEFLEQGTTINSERYVSTLRALKGRLRRVRQDKVKVKDVVIQHDNARPHTSRQTQCALQQLELPTIPHPPFDPVWLFLISFAEETSQRKSLWNRCRSWGGCSHLVPIPDTRILRRRNAKTCTTLAPLYWTRWWLCWKMIVHQIGETLSFHLMCNLLL